MVPFLKFLVPRYGGKGIFSNWPSGVVELTKIGAAVVRAEVELSPVVVAARSPGEVRLEEFADAPALATGILLADIEHAHVDGGTGAVMDQRMRLVPELSPYSKRSPVERPWDHPLFFRRKKVILRTLEGCHVLLAGPNSGVYFHWLLETLPRLMWLEQAGLLPSAFRCLVMKEGGFVSDSLRMIGITPERIVRLEPNTRYRLERLVATSYLHPQETAPHLALWMQKHFLSGMDDAAPSGRKLIYISRKDAGLRVVENEERFILIVRSHGGEVVELEGMSLGEQARLFHSAGCIVAPHGSALANLVFCRRGTKVLELFSPSYVRLLYPRIGTSLGLDYWYLIGSGRKERSGGPSLYASIRIDPREFENVLTEMLS